MQFGCALSQELYFFGINAADQFLQKNTWRRCFILKIGLALQDALVIPADRVHSQRPYVAFIQDRTLQKANNSWLRFGPAIFQCSDECWHVWEVGLLREEARYFHIRIQPMLEFSIKFQEKFVVEEHRRVALFRAQNV